MTAKPDAVGMKPWEEKLFYSAFAAPFIIGAIGGVVPFVAAVIFMFSSFALYRSSQLHPPHEDKASPEP